MPFTLPVVYPFGVPAGHCQVVLVGCGGTGGYVAPHLARLAAARPRSLSIYFIDPDLVEERNLERQNFIAPDLGRPKAEVLAERYSAAFGIPISYRAAEADPALLDEIARSSPDSPYALIISCVDNHYARATIGRFVQEYAHTHVICWIDAGNELHAGHVSLGCRGPFPAVPLLPPDPSGPGCFALPLVTEIFPEILEAGAGRPEVSCAERAQGDPQAIATNLTAATLVVNYVYGLVTGAPLCSHLVLFDVLNNAMETRLNTIDNLTAYLRSCVSSQPHEAVVVPAPALVSVA